MGFEADAIHLRDVEELDKLASDAVDPLDAVFRGFRACPELDPIDFRAETDDGAADLVVLVELLTDERHGKPLKTLVE